MPDTCRLLVFREQLETLVRQLTGGLDGQKVVRSISKFRGGDEHGISQNEFRAMVTPDNRLSDKEITLLYDYHGERFAESVPHIWCSTIAELALCIELDAYVSKCREGQLSTWLIT